MNNLILDKIEIGGSNTFVLIAGPCVIESLDHSLEIAKKTNDICKELKIPYIFKSSFQKANRSSIHSYTGVDLKEGMRIFKIIKNELKIPVTTDVHLPKQISVVKDFVDVIQIPAFLCRQTELLLTAAKTQKIINVKKGQFISPNEIKYIIEKIQSAGNNKIIITERGTSFGYNNLVVDMRTLETIKKLDVLNCFDATHSNQKPGWKNLDEKNQRDKAMILARAAVAIGIDALFLEIHNNPTKALCDKDNVLDIKSLPCLLKMLKKIDKLVKAEYE